MIPESHFEELDRLAGSYWWHVHRTRVVLELAGRFRGGSPTGPYLDVGCGTGAATRALADGFAAMGAIPSPSSVLGVDHDARLAGYCAKHAVPFAKQAPGADLSLPRDGTFAVFTALDVLEHLEDPARLLRSLLPSLRPDALGFITVPAFQFLYSSWDEGLGHHRRYRKEALRALLLRSGYEPLWLGYGYSFAFLPAIVSRKLGGRNDGLEFPKIPAWLNRCLLAAGAVERRLIPGIPLPFGTTLFAAVRPAASRCPACRLEEPASLLETYTDPIHLAAYRLYRCPACGVTFSEPRVPVGPDWYAQSSMNEGAQTADDWRYQTMLSERLPGRKLLDVGCGTGLFLSLAQRRGFEASGFDFNSAHVEQARANGVKDIWIMDQNFFFQNHEARYDIATLFDVLEHVPEPAGLLEGILKLLVPGGHLVVTVPNGDRPIPGRTWREEWDYPPYHFTRWTRGSLAAALESAGFEVRRCGYRPLPPTYFSGLAYFRLLRSVLPALKRLVLGVRKGESQKAWKTVLAERSRSGKVEGPLAQAEFRQRLVDAGFRVFSLLCSPIERPAVACLNRFRPQNGQKLYILARKP